MKNISVMPVILCGGGGTRLWPLSRRLLPKQFLSLPGAQSSMTLFQDAFDRINSIGNSKFQIDETLVVTNEEYRFLVLDQLKDFEKSTCSLILEPISRNTASALTLAALEAINPFESIDLTCSEDPILVVVPADQVINNHQNFIKTIQNSIESVARDESKKTISILGIKPTSPETGYGYIKCELSGLDDGGSFVEEFVEKPDFECASSYLKDGRYFWNSGIFVMYASTWLAAIKAFRADIFSSTENAYRAKTVEKFAGNMLIRFDNVKYADIPPESIDYAVMENCRGSDFSIKMFVLEAGWSDLGSWDAVWKNGLRDEQGNAISGDAHLFETKDSLVYASNRLVSVLGCKNLVVIETSDAILIADRAKSQDVKNIVAKLDSQKRNENLIHRKVSRPWGWFDTLEEHGRFKVKRILVNPGAKLSLQMHQHRAEHWIVVSGVAEITNGDQLIILYENESTYIPRGQIHRLANIGPEPLEIIEVQSGGYLGEDDIIRLDDSYGRN